MKLLVGGAVIATAILITSCRHEKPNIIFMPDMVYSPAYKAQKAQTEAGMRLPVAGTVSREQESFPYNDVLAAGAGMKNPLKRTKENLMRGKQVFNTYCIVCHGASGEGDGTIVPKFPRPPTLHSDKIKNYADGSIFYVMTKGQNLMPSYAAQIVSQDRWAVVHYIRALQRSKKPTPEDLKAYEEAMK